MALPADQQNLVDQLKRMIGVTTLTDEELYALIVAADGSLDTVAADLWTEKAASYAELTDVKEGSSSRDLSKLYEQALVMADKFKSDLAANTPGSGIRRSMTRAIERP